MSSPHTRLPTRVREPGSGLSPTLRAQDDPAYSMWNLEMMKKPNSMRWLLAMLISGLLCLSTTLAQAEGREIKPLKQWRGRVDNSLQEGEPLRGYIANQPKLDKLWAAWRIPGAKPMVDFKTQLVLVRTCNCSNISIAPLLNEQGDLHIQVTVTKDLREDTAYVIVLIPHQGIRTVEGKPLGD